MTVPEKKSKRGGARPGAGRPKTGRKRRTMYLTDVEYYLLKIHLDTIRMPGEDPETKPKKKRKPVKKIP